MMRVAPGFLLLLVLSAYQASIAQVQRTAPGVQSEGSQQPVQQYYARDGGTSEYLESIIIPPKSQAPFSMTLQTEWVKTLSDGGTMTLVNKRRIARDSTGRVFQERRLLIPKLAKGESHLTTIQIADPIKHVLYNCFMNPKHECSMSNYPVSVNAIYKFQGPPSGPLPHEVGYAVHEDLGQQVITGLDTTGTRDKTIYNAGVVGNDQTMTVMREFWYSAQLGFNLLSKISDPRFGTQTFTATDLVSSEPDQNLFKIPDGFSIVVEQRATASDN
jgi:hypothetical protein